MRREFFYRLVDESCRWLISQGRLDESIDIIKKIGHVNGRGEIPNDVIEAFKVF